MEHTDLVRLVRLLRRQAKLWRNRKPIGRSYGYTHAANMIEAEVARKRTAAPASAAQW